MTPPRLRMGSRESALALWQTHWVMEALQQQHGALPMDVLPTKTHGDKFLSAPITEIGSGGNYGVFVKELEEALLAGEIDVAIHSLKDMPSRLPEGLVVRPVGPREDPRDALLSRDQSSFSLLPAGARVGTSSLRRTAQLKRLRPDLCYEPLRGNLNTRLRKLEEGQYEAIVLAAAGVHRLGWGEKITQYFDLQSELIPAVGQGVLAAEFRAEDAWVADLFAPLVYAEVVTAVACERAVMATLDGGCLLPMGAHAWQGQGNRFQVSAILLSVDGDTAVEDKAEFEAAAATQAGEALGQALLTAGGHVIREKIKATASL